MMHNRRFPCTDQPACFTCTLAGVILCFNFFFCSANEEKPISPISARTEIETWQARCATYSWRRENIREKLKNITFISTIDEVNVSAILLDRDDQTATSDSDTIPIDDEKR